VATKDERRERRTKLFLLGFAILIVMLFLFQMFASVSIK